MTSESKILTVSYGTFSCTLEGFDNPFDTMKVIAEYFRDLAANDRYFGAEPPQPDAGMLHRVAEREVARLVENRLADGGSAPADPEETAPDNDSVAPQGTSTTSPVETGSEPSLSGSASAPDTAPKPVEPSLKEETPKGFSAKLARIRASANPPAAMPPIPEDQLKAFMPETDKDVGTHDAAERLDVLTRGPDLSESLGMDAAASSDVQDNSAAEAAPAEAETVSSPVYLADAYYEEAETEVMADSPEPEVEAAAGENPVAETEASEPETLIAEDEGQPAGDALLSDDPMEETALLDPELTANSAITTGEVYYRFDDEPEHAATDTPIAASPDLEGSGVSLEVSDEPALEADGTAEPVTVPQGEASDAEAPEMTLSDVAEDQPVSDEPLSGDVEDSAVSVPGKGSGRYDRISSRVVRLRADEGDNSPTMGDEAEKEPDPNATRVVHDIGMDSEMSRLLRQAEDVMSDDENRRRLDSIAMMKASVGDTDSDLGPPIEAPMTEDDRQDPYRDDLAKVVEPMPAPEPETPKPVRRKTRSVRVPDSRPGMIRPNAFGPPPLVLITEQRIDRAPPPMDASPIAAESVPAAPSPREGQPVVALRTGRLTGAIGIGSAAPLSIAPQPRIMLDQPYLTGQSDSDEEDDPNESLSPELESGLARFAEHLGLSSTVELLEAAAAYTTCIEDRVQFTRPQLMRRLMASAERGSISREDGLRGFGTLLRTGRIEKIGRGYYALSQNSPFLNEARRFS
ncbi:MAG: hypothetical protein JNK34_10380 [Tabrizicola sp.]|nr:hypothetical protein [Tabrizicola sp.]